MAKKENDVDLSKNLEKLSEIADWFDEQEEVDVEEGLKKVREAAELIKQSKGRLAEIENEFDEIKADIEEEIGDDDEEEEEGEENDEKEVEKKKAPEGGGINPDEIPF